MPNESKHSQILLAHQKAIYVYGTLDRNRAAFIQTIAEKDAAQIQPVDIADAQS